MARDILYWRDDLLPATLPRVVLHPRSDGDDLDPVPVPHHAMPVPHGCQDSKGLAPCSLRPPA